MREQLSLSDIQYLLEIMVLQIMYLLTHCFLTKPFQYMGNLYYNLY